MSEQEVYIAFGGRNVVPLRDIGSHAYVMPEDGTIVSSCVICGCRAVHPVHMEPGGGRLG